LVGGESGNGTMHGRKGCFLSINLERAYHDMRMQRISVQHTDWMRCHLAKRRGQLNFDDFVSGPFNIIDRLDQGTHIRVSFTEYTMESWLTFLERRKANPVLSLWTTP
jgi:hypothetical protein